jgi:ABC-type branched-subunit amino acid transport system ATPase component
MKHEGKMFEVRNLSSAYGQSEVLHGIDLAVMPGEIVALVGRNGMGKSTLMKSLIGVMPARSGQIVVDGTDVTALAPHQRVACGLAYVPQGRQIFGTMTVKENIETGLVVTGKREIPREIFDYFRFWRISRVGVAATSRAASSNSSPLHERWRAIRRSCCWMSLPKASSHRSSRT